MNELGRYLEAVYGPGDGFRSVNAVIQSWRDTDLALATSDGSAEAFGRRKRKATPGESAKIEETELSVSIELPHQFRIERIHGANDVTEDALLVANEEQWWCRDQLGRVETDKINVRIDRSWHVPGITSAERHFILPSLREYFVALAMEQTGLVEHSGCKCVRIRAVPRPNARLWPHWLPHCAEEYEFYGDIERGTLLYIAGIYQGNIFATHSVSQIDYDVPLDKSLFTYAPRANEPLHKAVPIAEHLSLESAASRVGFKVLLPAWLPKAGVGFEVIYQPARRQMSQPAILIMYRTDFALWLVESDVVDPDLDDIEFESFEHTGSQMRISGARDGRKTLLMEREGTYVTIQSDLNRDELIKVASSLEPITTNK